VQVVATSAAGLSSSPLLTSVTVSACGAFPPVTKAFSLSQAVPALGGGIGLVSDTPGTGAGLAVGGAAASAAGFYVAAPLTVSADVSDADTSGGTCGAFGVPPQVTTFSWSLVQAPAGSHASLGLATGPAVGLTPDVPGLYTLSITTADSTGSASTSTVTFSALCGASPPAIASLSASQAGIVTSQALPVPLAVGAPVSLGAVVVDPDASAGGACVVAEAQPFTYAWSFAQLPPGSTATLVGATTATPSFVPDVASDAGPAPVPYGLSVVVTDPQGHQATSRLDVNVTCDAAAPAVATVPGTTLPDFTATQQVPGLIVAGVGGTSTVTLTRSALGFLANRASANGGGGVPTSALFYPGFPVRISANIPTSQTSPGCGVYTRTLAYAWTLRTLPPGSTASLSGASGPTPSFVPDLPGPYELELVLTDQLGRTSRTVLALDTGAGEVVSVGACRPHLPAARVTAPVPSPISGVSREPLAIPLTLDASASQADAAPLGLDGSGGCGFPFAYSWSLESVPPGSTAALTTTGLSTTSLVADLPGDYGIRVTVTSGTSAATSALTVRGTGGYLSSPAATGAVFTATAVDGTGNPVVAWWDNTSGAVEAARCTAGCDGPAPTWTSLGTVDSGLTPLTFAPADEPRPVAVAVRGSTTYVAYYTSTGAGTTGAHGLRSCSVALAVHDGTAWVRWTDVDSVVGPGPFTSCTADGAPPFANYELGRWLSVTPAGAGLAVGYSLGLGGTPSQTALAYSVCSTADCSTFTPGVIDFSPLATLGRWNTLAADSTGSLHAAYYVDDDGAGLKGLRYATNATGSFSHANVESSPSVDAGRFASIAFIPPNPPAGPPGAEALVIAYADSTAKRAKVVRVTRPGGSWLPGAPAVVPDTAGTDVGRGAVVGVDPATGTLRVAYYDATNGFVRVAASADGSAFSTTGLLFITTGPGAPLGLSMASASGTALACSRAPVGPVGYFSGP
jgi:hypothetical protein